MKLLWWPVYWVCSELWTDSASIDMGGHIYTNDRPVVPQGNDLQYKCV